MLGIVRNSAAASTRTGTFLGRVIAVTTSVRSVPFSDETIETNEPERTNAVAIDQQLHSALATLPELHRAALTLRYFEEMDYRAIENTLGVSNGALRGILGRALASMRKQLRPALASMD